MLFQTLLACTLALTSLASADTNMQRFKHGLPPLPQKYNGSRMKRQIVPSTTPVPNNIRVRGLRVEMPEGSASRELQLSAVVSPEYVVYELVPLSRPGLAGTFVFTGFYSTTNQMPLYVFELSNGPPQQPYLVAAFVNDSDSVEGPSGAYLAAGGGDRRPYPQTDDYPVSDSTSAFTQAAIFQINRADPARPSLQFVTMDYNNQEQLSTEVCLDGDGANVFLPLLFNPCWPSAANSDELENGRIILDLA